MTMLKRLSILILALTLLLMMVLPTSAAQAIEKKTVKVGFFSADGYHIMNEDGIRSGYGYDFLQMLLRFEDWHYEYIGYDLNWGEMLDLLDRGEIDLVTLANKTPEREERFDYSAQPIGTSSTILTAASEHEGIVAGDYSTYNNAAIGFVEGSAHNENFAAYAAQNGFSYTAVYYDDIADLLDDLRSHNQIQIAVTSNMRVAHDEVILDEFNQTPYYAIVKKGNTQLLEELNHAINQLNVYSSGWQTGLFQKYYSNKNSEVISLSSDERGYLSELSSRGAVIKAAMNPELAPYAYFADGQACGIVPRIFQSIADRLNIQYEIIAAKNRGEYKQLLQAGQVDVDLTAFQDFGIAQQYGLSETDAYLSAYLSMISRNGASLDTSSLAIATVPDPTEFALYNNELIYSNTYRVYNSLEECVRAVKQGECDAAYFYAYSAEKILAEDYAHQLQSTILPEYSFGLTFGVQNNADHRLLSVLNKGVNSLTDAYVKSICLEEITRDTQTVPLIGIVYSHPLVVTAVAAGFVLLLASTVLLIVVNRNKQRMMLTNAKLNRFIGYICESYDLVTELNLKDRIRTDYFMKAGHLVERTYPYIPLVREDYEKIAKPEDIEKILAVSDEMNVGQLIDGCRQTHFDVQIKDPTGQYRWYTYIMKGIAKDEQHPRNYIMFKRDIQAQKDEAAQQQRNLRDALQAAKSASAAKGQFLSRMSHEIRTPLNAVIGYMEIAKDPDNDRNQIMHCVDSANTAAKHLLSIINDVLDISAIESGRMKVAHEDFNLKELITDISALFYHQAEEKGAQLSVLLSGITQEWVIGDKLRVNQILLNLLSNAIKFTPKAGKITLKIDQLRREDGKVFFRFEISDTGIGMSEEFQAKLFEPFVQESAVTAQKYGGTGLGLSITSNLIKMMGGSISVESRQNVGTTFAVTLHFDVSSHPENTVQETDFSHVRVLVADDEASQGAYIKAALKRCGVKSDLVSSGEMALKRLKSRAGTEYAYDLCILDWKMSDMNGVEVAKEVRAAYGADLPIIIATAYDATALMDEAKAAGVNSVVSKPLFQSTLVDLLARFFGTQKLQSAAAKTRTENLSGIHLLLAEDNAMNMEIAVTVLEKAGAAVAQAVDGQQAVNMFLAAPKGTYDLILMDIQMPVLNGYEATQKIRHAQHPESATIPIIAMTANAFSEDVAQALSSGMNAHIAKPINYEKLYRIVSKYCRKESPCTEKNG